MDYDGQREYDRLCGAMSAAAFALPPLSAEYSSERPDGRRPYRYNSIRDLLVHCRKRQSTRQSNQQHHRQSDCHDPPEPGVSVVDRFPLVCFATDFDRRSAPIPADIRCFR